MRLRSFPRAVCLVWLVVSVPAGSAATACQDTPTAELHVKFVEGTDTKAPLDLLPPGLSHAVRRIAPLFTLSTDKLTRLGADRLKLWYRITLEPGTDVDRFARDLDRLDVVESVERAPLPKPPPEPAVTRALLVEFRAAVGNGGPLSLLPSELADAVVGFARVSEHRYRIELKPDADADLAAQALRRLDQVLSAERVPDGPPLR